MILGGLSQEFHYKSYQESILIEFMARTATTMKKKLSIDSMIIYSDNDCLFLINSICAQTLFVLIKFTLKYNAEYIYTSHRTIAFIFLLTRNPAVPNLNSTGKIKGNFLDVIYTIRSPLSGRSIPFPGASGKRHYGKFGT